MADHAGTDALATSALLTEAWARYQSTMEKMRKELEDCDHFVQNPEQRAMGYRHLFEAMAASYNFAIAPRTSFPRLFLNTSWQTEFYAIGGVGPDFHYCTTFLDGRLSYRLYGNLKDTKYFVCQVNSALPGTPGSKCSGNYDFANFHVEENGDFEVTISADKVDGNWIALDPTEDYQWMLFRPLIQDWDAKPVEMRIERISEHSPSTRYIDEFTDEIIAKRITAAADYVQYMFREWVIGFTPRLTSNSGGVNIPAVISEDVSGEAGSPSCQYTSWVFEVDHDEALIIEMTEAPDASYWSIALFDLYLRTLPYRTQQAALNMYQAVPDSDGAIRLVISREDPGVANWLDNGGYAKGQVLLRCYGLTSRSNVTSQRIKLADLATRLPHAAPSTAPERTKALTERLDAYWRRYRE